MLHAAQEWTVYVRISSCCGPRLGRKGGSRSSSLVLANFRHREIGDMSDCNRCLRLSYVNEVFWLDCGMHSESSVFLDALFFFYLDIDSLWAFGQFETIQRRLAWPLQP